MAGIGLGDSAGVVIDLPRTVVTPGKGVPVPAPQGSRSRSSGVIVMRHAQAVTSLQAQQRF